MPFVNHCGPPGFITAWPNCQGDSFGEIAKGDILLYTSVGAHASVGRDFGRGTSRRNSPRRRNCGTRGETACQINMVQRSDHPEYLDKSERHSVSQRDRSMLSMRQTNPATDSVDSLCQRRSDRNELRDLLHTPTLGSLSLVIMTGRQKRPQELVLNHFFDDFPDKETGKVECPLLCFSSDAMHPEFST
jgi:hypothetical protein